MTSAEGRRIEVPKRRRVGWGTWRGVPSATATRGFGELLQRDPGQNPGHCRVYIVTTNARNGHWNMTKSGGQFALAPPLQILEDLSPSPS